MNTSHGTKNNPIESGAGHQVDAFPAPDFDPTMFDYMYDDSDDQPTHILSFYNLRTGKITQFVEVWA